MTGLNSFVRGVRVDNPVSCRPAQNPKDQENASVARPRPEVLRGVIFAKQSVQYKDYFRGVSGVGATPSVDNPEVAGIQRTKWVLTKEALEQFLSHLDPDQDRAGAKYEEIRRKLLTFFRCNGFWDAEDHVDETIDRTIRRLDEVRDLMPFIRGVARHVASEVRRMAPREIPLEDIREIASRGQRDEEGERSFSKRLKWWYECADRLTAEDREMLLQYYQYDRSQKVENKRNLAALMGTSTAILRVRAFRARKQLEKLVVESMKGFPANET